MNIEIENLRITKLRKYLFEVIDKIVKGDYQINADMLDDNVENYSLDKIPTGSTIEKWICGTEIHKDVFSFRSRRLYSQDTIENLKNIGFFEIFEQMIYENNRKGILPEIDNIESIECLNCGTMINSDGNRAEFEIQIQITFTIL